VPRERRQHAGELSGVAAAVSRILREAAIENVVELGREDEIGAHVREARRRRHRDARAEDEKVALFERSAPRQHLEQDDAERPDVGARVDLDVAAKLLRPFAVNATSARPFRGVSFEIPKSTTLTIGAPPRARARNRFAGLRSRWMTPARCTSAMAVHA